MQAISSVQHLRTGVQPWRVPVEVSLVCWVSSSLTWCSTLRLSRGINLSTQCRVQEKKIRFQLINQEQFRDMCRSTSDKLAAAPCQLLSSAKLCSVNRHATPAHMSTRCNAAQSLRACFGRRLRRLMISLSRPGYNGLHCMLWTCAWACLPLGGLYHSALDSS